MNSIPYSIEHSKIDSDMDSNTNKVLDKSVIYSIKNITPLSKRNIRTTSLLTAPFNLNSELRIVKGIVRNIVGEEYPPKISRNS